MEQQELWNEYATPLGVRYRAAYLPRVTRFLEVSGRILAGRREQKRGEFHLTHPHLPQWGSGYEEAPFKIAVLTQNAAIRGDWEEVIARSAKEPHTLLHRPGHPESKWDLRDRLSLRNLPYGKQTEMAVHKMLQTFYGAERWENLPLLEREAASERLFWIDYPTIGSVYPIEPGRQIEERSSGREVPPEEDDILFLSEECFDSLELALEVAKPDLLLVLFHRLVELELPFQRVEAPFSRKCEWFPQKREENYVETGFYKPTGTRVFALPVPKFWGPLGWENRITAEFRKFVPECGSAE